MTFDDVAAHFDVTRCSACNRYNHRTGEWVVATQVRPGHRESHVTIHWSDRRVTRAGLRRFLMLIHDGQHLYDGRRERWYRRWQASIWAASVARKELHITLPVRLSANDRAYVWAHIQTAINVPAACRSWATPKEATNGNRD